MCANNVGYDRAGVENDSRPSARPTVSATRLRMFVVRLKGHLKRPENKSRLRTKSTAMLSNIYYTVE